MTIIVAVVLSTGSGVTKMYNISNFNYLFYAANILILILLAIFVFLVKLLHKKTNELKDIK